MANNPIKKLAIGLLATAGILNLHADSLTWDPGLSGGSGGTGTWDLNTTANWWNGAADEKWVDVSTFGTNSAIFSGTAGTVTANTSLSTSNLQFLASGYTLQGSGTITLGAGGIDNSSVNSGATTIGNNLSLAAGQQYWQSGSGGTLAINGTITRATGVTVDFLASGAISNATVNVNGILGGWATTGDTLSSTTTGDWMANDGNGNLITYTGYSLVGGSTNGTGASASNWKNSAAGTVITLTASATLNSLVQQGDFSVANGTTLTLGSGGLILQGISRWMLDNGGGNLGTAVLTSGASSGELFVHTPNGAPNIALNSSSGGNWRIWPQIKDNGATPLVLVKDGPGLVVLQNTNSYTGGTYVNNGILVAGGANTFQALEPATTGSGTITVRSPGILEIGFGTQNAGLNYFVNNSLVMNGGKGLANDGIQHFGGSINVLAGGATFGSTYDGGANSTTGNKGLFLDGVISGSGPISLMQASQAGECGYYNNPNGNAFNSSFVAISNNANTYSGTISIVPYTSGTGAGSYLAINGSTALQFATLYLTNNTGGHRFAAVGGVFSPLVFNTGLGSATVGGITGSGNIILSGFNEFTYTNFGDAIALTVGGNNASTTESGNIVGSGSLIKVGTGTLTLGGTNTYTGNTTINAGTLALTGAWIGSTNTTTVPGATLDVSALGSITMSGTQKLFGGGTVNGTVNTSSGSAIYAGTDGGYGTNTITGSVTLASGSTVNLDVGTVHNGSNDLVTVAGTLTANNNVIHLKAPSTLVNLDASADYVLITSASPISGSFAAGPTWDVAPANAAHYSIVTGANTVTLHYAAFTTPSGIGTASPSPALRNQSVLITVTATNGTGGTVNAVSVDASTIGGSSTVALVQASSSGSVTVWTNTVAVAPATLAGGYGLIATLTDTASLHGVVNIPLTVIVGNDVWNGLGADNNFSTFLNWTNKLAPGYVGDSLEFAGTTDLTPNMDNNYTITSLLFDSGAGAFNISSGNTLTFSGVCLITNNSVNGQTLNMPVAGSSGLTVTGVGPITLTAGNTYTGPTVLTVGGLNITGSLASTNNFSVGTAVGNSTVGISGTVTPYYLLIGDASNSVSAVYQTGGSITASAASGFDNLAVGNVGGAYGYYNAAGGSLTVNGVALAGEDNAGSGASFGGLGGSGIMDITGGSVSDTGWFVIARNTTGAQIGELNVYNGGSLTYAGGGLVCNWGSSSQTVMINILGGSVTSSAQGVGLGGGGTDILNLNGGLLEASVVTGNFGGTHGQLNFNGGTLQGSVNITNFIAVTTARIYGGGATIDDQGFPITIGQPLLAPAGNGVQSISSFTGGAGYIAPPIIIVTNGTGDTTGSGATAIAQINPTTGTVTNILITCPGVNYTAIPQFLVIGGGATTAATITGTNPVANVSGGLTVLSSGTTMTLLGASTYTGNTTISAGTLALGSTASLASTNINVQGGAIFDVSVDTNFTLASGQAFSGTGNINGSPTNAAGSKIFPATDGTAGTLTFNNGLTLASGAMVNLDLSTVYNSGNDQVVVSGALTANGNSIHIKAPSTGSSLDTTADYTLITAASITGSFATAPVWDVTPVNAAHFTVVTSGTTVTLHYNASVAAPTITASASPTTLLRNQSTLITAVVTPGTFPISTVTVDTSPFGGSLVSLVRSNSSNVYTNNVTVPAGASPGGVSLTVTATDTGSQTGSASVNLTVNSSTEVWAGGGANQNWSTNANWVSGSAPGYTGDTLVFAGVTGLTPNMNNSYSANGLSFSNNAGSFAISSAASTLTLAGDLVNNSTAAQTFNVPLALGSSINLNAAAGNVVVNSNITLNASSLTLVGNKNVTLNGNVSGTGSLTKNGTGTLTLGSGNVSAGLVSFNSGTALVSSTLSSAGTPTYVGYLTNTATVNMSGGTWNIGGEIRVGGSDQNGPTVIGSGAMTVSGGTVYASALTVARGNYLDNTINGTLTLNSGSTFVSTNDTVVEFAGKGLGKVILNGGNYIIGPAATKWFMVGYYDTGAGEVDVTNGNLILENGTSIKMCRSGNTGGNFFNQFGGNVSFYSDAGVTLGGGGALDLDYAGGASSASTYNLNGGTLTVPAVYANSGTGTSTFNFNGGTLKPTTASTTFMQGITRANVRNSGAVIDTAGLNVTIAQALAHSSVGGDNATDGGLTKLGAGTLTLSGANSYNGTTTVNAGTLDVSQAVLATNAAVVITNGAVLQLDFATTNQVSGLVLNGTNEPAGIYNSTTTPSFIAGTGSLRVQPVATSAPQIVLSVSGGTMTLSWPAANLGMTLQVQTNNLATGLGTNWVDVAGSSSNNTNTITINPAAPSVFYRLRP